MSWEDAQRYARWAGLRLPGEAEWEYGCRGGTTTPYYTGTQVKDLDRAGWYTQNSDQQLHPVGEKEPNGFGLYDMHGNVWEWVEDDWHDDYKKAPKDAKPWIEAPERGSGRVLRGGCWNRGAAICRSATRSGYWPGNRDDDLGFRLSRSVALDP